MRTYRDWIRGGSAACFLAIAAASIWSGSSANAQAQPVPSQTPPPLPDGRPLPQFDLLRLADFGTDDRGLEQVLDRVNTQLARAFSANYTCREQASGAIAWLDQQASQLGNIFAGSERPDLQQRNDKLQADLRRFSAYLKGLPPCQTPASTGVRVGQALPPAPLGRPFIIEPFLGVGIGGTSQNASYTSTGGQPPFAASSSKTNSQFCGGMRFWPGPYAGPARLGIDVSACSGSGTFNSGGVHLFQIARHGPGGLVTFRALENFVIDVHAIIAVPLPSPFRTETAGETPRPRDRVFFTFAAGPSFRQQQLTLSSDQSLFGGGIPSARRTTTQTGLGIGLGLFAEVCPDCIGGNPLLIGVNGTMRFFPSQSIAVRSPAFGFTEFARTGRKPSFSVMTNVSVPFHLQY